ncbi:MAG: HAD family hydrolase [Candidatus Limnocylindrales bacterium]
MSPARGGEDREGPRHPTRDSPAADPFDVLLRHRLVVFDKDGTLIEFHAMWGGWAVELASDLETATHRSIREPLFDALGVDWRTARILPHGALAATPMSTLRAVAVDIVARAGCPDGAAEAAVQAAWHPPDPVALAEPFTDLVALFEALRAAGTRVAVATTDDREPTERTMAALGLADLVDGTVCADDGLPVKPAPDMIEALCDRLHVTAGDVALVGDSPADLLMGRAARVRTTIGVLSGTGTTAELGPLADLLLPSVAAFSVPS